MLADVARRAAKRPASQRERGPRKGRRLNVLPQAIDDTLYDAFGQRQVSTIFTQLNQYRVILEVEPQFQQITRVAGQDLREIHDRADGSADARSRRFRSAPRRLSIVHEGQFPAVTLSFNLAPGRSLGRGRGRHQAARRRKSACRRRWRQHSPAARRNFGRRCKSEPFLILAAIVVIYIVLGVLYESYIHPHHDSLQPAVGRRGRVAGADCLP